MTKSNYLSEKRITFAAARNKSKEQTMTKNITADIRYIGVDDPEQHLFESQYHTPDGMCYNSYVILDEKVAIMDTSDSRTMEAWKANLKEALAGRQPDYLIVQHLEPDHASGIAEVCALYPQMQIVCSAKALQMMPQYMSAPHSAPEGATAPTSSANKSTEAPSGAVWGGQPRPHRQGGRHPPAGSPHPAVHHGTHGALARGDGHL